MDIICPISRAFALWPLPLACALTSFTPPWATLKSLRHSPQCTLELSSVTGRIQAENSGFLFHSVRKCDWYLTLLVPSDLLLVLVLLQLSPHFFRPILIVLLLLVNTANFRFRLSYITHNLIGSKRCLPCIWTNQKRGFIFLWLQPPIITIGNGLQACLGATIPASWHQKLRLKHFYAENC